MDTNEARHATIARLEDLLYTALTLAQSLEEHTPRNSEAQEQLLTVSGHISDAYHALTTYDAVSA